jgi:dTMP kinase
MSNQPCQLPEIDVTKLAGKLITFEGVEGCGKSTQLALLHDYLLAKGCDVVTTKEPSAIAKKLLMEMDGLDATGQLLLLMADRQNHVATVIRPALDRGAIVLCDRYIDSTLAYQCFAGGASDQLLEMLRQQLYIPLPDITIWLDMPYQKGLDRAKARGSLDKIERMPEDYHALVQYGFEAMANQPRVLRVEADGEPMAIHWPILRGIERRSADVIGPALPSECSQRL